MISNFDFTDSYGKKYLIAFEESEVVITPENELGKRFGFDINIINCIKFLIDNDIGNLNMDVKNFLIRVMKNMMFV